MQAMGMGRVLVGRQAQVEALQEFLHGAPAGPPVMLVAGEAGVGKTALVDHVLAGAGQPVRRGRAVGRKSAGYEVLAQVLTAAGGDLPAGPARELALVLPGLGPPPAEASQSALAAAVCAVLARQAG